MGKKRKQQEDVAEEVQEVQENIDEIFKGESKEAAKSVVQAPIVQKLSLSHIKLGAEHFITEKKEGHLEEGDFEDKKRPKKKSRDALPDWILAAQKIDDKDKRPLDNL